MFSCWAMSQFVRLLRSLSVSSVIVPRLSKSEYVMLLPPPNFKPSFHKFWYMKLYGMRFEPLVGMCLTILEVCLVCKYVGITFGLGVRQLALCWYWNYAWFCLPVFGIVDCFKDVSVQTAGIGRGSYLYSSRCTSYAWRADLFGDSSKMELCFYDVILGMDWLSRHWVVLDCLRARVHIAGADGSFYCVHATCWGVIRYRSSVIFGDHFDG